LTNTVVFPAVIPSRSKTIVRPSKSPRGPRHLPRGSYLLLRLESGRQLYVSAKHWLFTLEVLPEQPRVGEVVDPTTAALVWLLPKQLCPGQWLIVGSTLDRVNQITCYD